MKKNIYIQPVVEMMPVCAMDRVCVESFFDPLYIGDPSDPGSGR